MVETRNPLPMTLKVVKTSGVAFAGAAPVSRDLGLGQASDDVFVARRVRAGSPDAVAAIAGDPSAWFTFIYVLAGEVTLSVDGEPLVLRPHDAVSQVPITAGTLLAMTHDFEFLEVVARDCPPARRLMPERPRRTIALDSPDAHELGTGPRSFFDYRNLGVAEATGGQIEVQVVRAQRAKEGGTGWHSHDMAQLSFGLSGWAMLDVEGVNGQVRQGPGDALSIPSDWRHNASSFSDDYWALQLQVPARYDTVVRDAPPFVETTPAGVLISES